MIREMVSGSSVVLLVWLAGDPGGCNDPEGGDSNYWRDLEPALRRRLRRRLYGKQSETSGASDTPDAHSFSARSAGHGGHFRCDRNGDYQGDLARHRVLHDWGRHSQRPDCGGFWTHRLVGYSTGNSSEADWRLAWRRER